MERIRRPSMTEEVIRSVIKFINQNELVPGDRLPSERELINSFGVSRPTVREALSALAALSIIESRQGQGYFVKTWNDDILVTPQVVGSWMMSVALTEIHQARQVLEVESIRLATQRATVEDYVLLDGIMAQLKEGVEGSLTREEVYTLSMVLHETIALASGNTLIYRLIKLLSRMAREAHMRFYTGQVSSQQEYTDHLTLVEAVKQGDPAAAATAMASHLLKARRVIDSSVERNKGGL